MAFLPRHASPPEVPAARRDSEWRLASREPQHQRGHSPGPRRSSDRFQYSGTASWHVPKLAIRNRTLLRLPPDPIPQNSAASSVPNTRIQRLLLSHLALFSLSWGDVAGLYPRL